MHYKGSQDERKKMKTRWYVLREKNGGLTPRLQKIGVYKPIYE